MVDEPINLNKYKTLGPFNPEYNKMALKAHNEYRKLHQAPDLVFDEEAAI
jgi:hypothetical protein